MTILETERLTLRQLTLDDAEFILGLLNEPSWLQFIGDKNVRTLDDARAYRVNGPQKMYREHGFGLWLVVVKETAVPAGMCGLIKRPTLDDIDIGFAFLPRFWGRGYAHEAAVATLAYARNVVKPKRIVALTALDNPRSIRLLGKLGLTFERIVRLTPDGPESRLFATAPSTPTA